MNDASSTRAQVNQKDAKRQITKVMINENKRYFHSLEFYSIDYFLRILFRLKQVAIKITSVKLFLTILQNYKYYVPITNRITLLQINIWIDTFENPNYEHHYLVQISMFILRCTNTPRPLTRSDQPFRSYLHFDSCRQTYQYYNSLMAERKVLIKYIPKNFDPDRIQKRGRGKDRLIVVRNMLPMTIRCNTCSNYLYIGTKFNMRMQISNTQMYLGIKVFRFYFRCTFCYAEISFKTDPKNYNYVVETGGVRNYDPARDALQAEKLLLKLKKDEKEGDSMKFLQSKTYDSKREMELLDTLEEIKNQNKRQANIDVEQLLKQLFEQEIKRQLLSEQEEQAIDDEYERLREEKRLQTLGEKAKEQSSESTSEHRVTEPVKESEVNFGFKKPTVKRIIKRPTSDKTQQTTAKPIESEVL